MVASHPFRRTPHTFPGLIKSSSQGPSGKVRRVALRRFLNTSYAPWRHRGAPTKTPVAEFAGWRHANFGAPHIRFVAP